MSNLRHVLYITVYGIRSSTYTKHICTNLISGIKIRSTRSGTTWSSPEAQHRALVYRLTQAVQGQAQWLNTSAQVKHNSKQDQCINICSTKSNAQRCRQKNYNCCKKGSAQFRGRLEYKDKHNKQQSNKDTNYKHV